MDGILPIEQGIAAIVRRSTREPIIRNFTGCSKHKRKGVELGVIGGTGGGCRKLRRVSIQKTVRFAPVLNHAYVFPRIPEEEKHLIWYNSKEVQCIQRCNSYNVQHIAQGGDGTYRNNLLMLVGVTCGRVPITSDDARNSCLAIANSPLRGLERDTIKCFRQRQRRVVANVLQTQASCKAWKGGDADKDAKNFVSSTMAAHYSRVAAPAAKFARLLAVGDATAS